MLKTLWKKIFQDSPEKMFSAWQVELTTRCPLECRMCSRTAYKDFYRQDMPLEEFKKLLPYLGQVESLVLEGWGESLLHPNLIDCLKLAKQAGPRAGFVTSGNGLSEPFISEILEAGADFMGFSISGATARTHNYIRVNSDLDDLLKWIRVIQEMKVRKALETPRLHIVYPRCYSVDELGEHQPWRVFGELPPVDEFVRLIERGRSEPAVVSARGAGDLRP